MNILFLLFVGTAAIGQAEIPQGWKAEYGVTPEEYTEQIIPLTLETQQPRLGFNGTLVDLDPRLGLPRLEELPSRGMLVNQVAAKTPAARMGLERGDLVISIDSMRFNSQAGYLHALRCASQRPSLIILDVRTKRFLRRSVYLPHAELPFDEAVPHPPDTYWMSIDLQSDFNP